MYKMLFCYVRQFTDIITFVMWKTRVCNVMLKVYMSVKVILTRFFWGGFDLKMT